MPNTGTAANLASTLTPELLDQLIQQAQARYVVAILILSGMLCVALAAILFALQLRKCAYVALIGYGAIMSFLGIGFAYIFGPVVIFGSAAAFIREFFFGRKCRHDAKESLG